ncbi:MAG TPA: hypothetical protein PKW90_04555 [Myxococcota bacterium]|nr:hypothetical protein [Myxococcota bacterium]
MGRFLMEDQTRFSYVFDSRGAFEGGAFTAESSLSRRSVDIGDRQSPGFENLFNGEGGVSTIGVQ